MFGNNPILKQELTDGSYLHIVAGSPWLTIQGEGPHIGHPAIFIRLHGCNLACMFCDTQFSSPDDPSINVDELVRQVQNIRGNTRLVVITGGEPFRQEIRPLCRKLWMKNHIIQIETAGTLWLEGIQQWAEIVCSPKTPTVHDQVQRYARCFKYVVDANMEFDGYVPITATQKGARKAKLAAPTRERCPVYLSPLDTQDDTKNKVNVKLVGKLAIENGCIAGVQLHKIMGLD